MDGKEIKFKLGFKKDGSTFWQILTLDEIIEGKIAYGGRRKPDYTLRYTGLKDKKGTELYEADKIKHGDLQEVGIIKFGHPFCQGFIIRFVEDFLGNRIEPNDTVNTTWCGLGISDEKCIEIIGNEYER
jgi:hypothetical protein